MKDDILFLRNASLELMRIAAEWLRTFISMVGCHAHVGVTPTLFSTEGQAHGSKASN